MGNGDVRPRARPCETLPRPGPDAACLDKPKEIQEYRSAGNDTWQVALGPGAFRQLLSE